MIKMRFWNRNIRLRLEKKKQKHLILKNLYENQNEL